MLKINCDNNIGFGDVICLAWVYETIKQTYEIELFATSERKKLLNFFKIRTTSNKNNSIIVENAFKIEISDILKNKIPKIRLEYILDYLKIPSNNITFKRPNCQLSQQAINFAENFKKNFPKNIIAIFPQTNGENRRYPSLYWTEIYFKLQKSNIEPIIFLKNKDSNFDVIKNKFYLNDLEYIAAIMLKSKLVVGNDSLPCHLSSTLNVKTLCVLGPTRGEIVFGHCKNSIHFITSDKLPCIGCHFATMFRPECHKYCKALFDLSPDDVVKKIDQIIFTKLFI